MFSRRKIVQLMTATALAAGMMTPAFAADKVRIALVVKALGIGFFDAVRDGGLEAAKELGNVEVIYTGPTKTTAEEQIAVIDSLIAQKVDAIAISANDTDALVPVCKKPCRAALRSFLSTRASPRMAVSCTSTRPTTRSSAPNWCR